jgi:molybdopterin/thiamine biosynthesis adenylyltransferase
MEPSRPNQPDSQPEPEPLWIGEEDRYARLRMIGWWDQARLARARVLVVGAGALGNEVLKNLALVGIGHILVIDFDTIELSNLSRSVLFRASDQGQSKAAVAARMASELNPDSQIIGRRANVLTDIGVGLVRDLDLVICCVDNREARLWINRLCWKAGRPWIDGGIQEINGVAKVFVPGNGACYECAMTENDYRLIQLRYSCPLLRREDLQQGKVPTAPTIASIIGGLQVQEALKLLHELPAAAGTALVFNGVANRFYQTRYPHRDDCLSHDFYEHTLPAPLRADQTTPRDLFSWLAKTHQLQGETLELDRDLVTALICDRCQLAESVNCPTSQLEHASAICPSCGELRRPEMLCEIAADAPQATLSLQALGIPRADIVRIRVGEERHLIELRGDAPTAWEELGS